MSVKELAGGKGRKRERAKRRERKGGQGGKWTERREGRKNGKSCIWESEVNFLDDQGVPVLPLLKPHSVLGPIL